jgi:hypothetical protein
MAEYTKNTPGAPNSGLYNVGDVVTDSTGTRWQAITGGVGGAERFVGKTTQTTEPAVTSVTTAGAATITAAQILTGTYVRDCAGASRTDTLSTAALLVAALAGRNPKVGQVLELHVINGSDPITEILTLTEGAGGGWDAAQPAAARIVPGGSSKRIKIRLTNVTAAAEAYVIYA